MKDLKRMSINMLCRFGKFGVGKSLTLGMYEFDVPKELTECITYNNDISDYRNPDIKKLK